MIVQFIVLFHKTKACAPPISFGGSHDPAVATMNALKLLGDPTHAQNGNNPVVLDPSAAPGSIKDPVDLFCYDFDEKCRWRNMEGDGIDELDWFQGSGFLDESKLRIATGTEQSPDGFYSIVAADKALSPDKNAVLASDIIDCQMGPAELRFQYWTSPGVRIVVCTKGTTHTYPQFDFCSEPIENGDPGPAFVSLPDLSGQAFQIFIRSENFVLETPTLQGGFAIIDNLEYFGDLCSKGMGVFNHGVNFIPLQGPMNNDITEETETTAELATEEEKLIPLGTNPVFSPPEATTPAPFVTLLAKQRQIRPPATTPLPFTTQRSQFTPVNANACTTLNCTFSSGICLDYIEHTDWKIAHGPVGNPATGIRGDASLLPFNREGAFAFITGPKPYSRIKTRPFEVEQDVNFLFAYYKVSQKAELRLIMKRENETIEEVLFEAPPTTIESRRWFRESRVLTVGRYDYITFEVRNLPSNAYVGLDEFIILNEQMQPFCPVVAESTFINSFDDNSGK
uniref:MAM domain-containing protein n=1 Tax=Panagrellus redivivus TaxID=6233 RepID=A0A7E4W7N1_PANRE